MPFTYPSPRRDESVVNDYHGTKICDPYSWMEDPDAEETKAFVDAENEVTDPFIEKCPYRSKLHDRIKEMWDYPKYSCPMKHGGKYYFYHNTGLQNQSVLKVQDSIKGEESVFLDPNELSEDGTVAIRNYCFSEDGKNFAYGLSSKGSDWVTIKVRDCGSKEDLKDVIERVKFSCLSWTHDHKGFFYNSYPKEEGKQDGTETATNINQKLFYHRLGTKQSEDVLCAEFPENPKWMTGAEVSDCGRYIIVAIRQGCDPVNRLYYCDMNSLTDGIKGLLPFVKVVDNFDAEYEYITNQGSMFTFKTNLDSPRYKLINIDFNDYAQDKWADLVPQEDKDVLDWAACVHENHLVLCYLHDVKNVLHMYDLKSGKKITTFPLDIGSVVGYSKKKKVPTATLR